MQIRHAKDDETSNIKEIWNYCFNDEESFVNYYFKDKYKSQNTVVVEEEGEIVSSLQLNQYKVKLNNKIYNSSYVVGVSTFPQVRGKGYMRNIMEFTLKELYKRNQLISILMPIDYRLYRKYGYEHCYDQLEYNLDIEDLRSFRINGSLHKFKKNNIKDLVEINKLFVRRLNGNVHRDEEYYENLVKEIESENGHIYLYKDKNGYEGYIIYFINGDKMFVREIFYENIEALKSMLKFIYNHNTQCKKVTISAPVNDKIRFILENPRTSDIKLKPFMMGRIINLKKYLETLDIESKLEGSINIFIKDDFISENNNIFKIEIKNHKLKVTPVNKEYDVYFDINTISQLAFSYVDVQEAILLNNIKIDKEKMKVLMRIFRKKDNYINEYV